MVKKLLFLIMSFITLSAGAQSIVYDQTGESGVRTVICNGMNAGVSNSIREFGIRNRSKKLVISPIFYIFISEKQQVIKYINDDYQ